jgi:broad specificity phosphatase PhoE
MLKKPNEYEIGKTTVLFIRHGDRIHIPGDEGIGLITPGPGLTELGRKQARDVAQRLSKFRGQIDLLYCSDMTRAIETAQEISKKIGKKPIVIKELSEIGHNLWKKKVYTRDFWKHYIKHKKSIKALDKILEKNEGKLIVIVAHGNLIKGLIFKKLGLSFKQIGFFHHHNCSVSSARFSGKKLDHINFYNSKDIILGN